MSRRPPLEQAFPTGCYDCDAPFVAGPEREHHFRHQGRSDREECPQPQLAPPKAGKLFHLGPGSVNGPVNVVRIPPKGLSCLGEHRSLRVPLHKRSTDFVFEFRYLL
ncbi:hypothetical protein ACVWZ7_000416 [Arthrobacter sp. TE12232]